MNKKIKPFSNGTEALSWQDYNCYKCKLAYIPGENENQLPDYEETLKLIANNRECELKFQLDYGYVVGEIDEKFAKEIGLTENGGLVNRCSKFIKR